METEDEFGENSTLPGSDDNHEHPELSRGTSIDRYLIVEPIGAGGMGAVYRVYDPKLNRGIALKILSVKQADLGAAQRAKTRLIREAQALAQLSHPNVVAVHDYGSFDNDVFIAMELVEGKTLDEWIKAEKHPIKEVLRVLIAAGRGLSAAHKAGLVHRDFKPGNVIIGDDGRVRVLDFGLARASDEKLEEVPKESDGHINEMEISSDSSPNLLQSPLTIVGGIVGTPLYMAPEQHLGQKTDERTDQFGFCLVLYEALYGKRPFAAKTIEDLKSAVIRNQVCIPPADTGVPVWLWKIIHKGLSTKPDDRYSTVEELLDALAEDPQEVQRQQRLVRRRKLFMISLMMLAIALPVGVWYGLRYRTFQLCKNAEGEIADVWDDAMKASVQKAFVGTKKTYALGTWERVQRIFDSYLAEWTQMRSDVCEGKLLSATLSEDLFDLRLSCLRKRIGELEALVKVFVKADVGVVQKAIQASSSLTDIAICADEEALHAPYPPPKTAEDRSKVAAIREKLVEVGAFAKTGKYQEGLELTHKLESEAKATDYQPVEAEVYFYHGKLLSLIGDYKKSETALYEAARLAGESRDALLVAKAMTSLVWVVGYCQARHEAGLLTARDAGFMLSVAGGDDSITSQLLSSLGVVFRARGEFEKALEKFQKALELIEDRSGHKHFDRARTLNSIGATYYRMGKYNKALDYFQRAFVIQENVIGAAHPMLANPLNNIANVYRKRGEFDKAQKTHTRALSIRVNALGSEHPAVAQSYNNIGNVFFAQGQYEKASENYRKALAIREKILGHDHPDVATTLDNIGLFFQSIGDYEKALVYHQKAKSKFENSLGLEHLDVATPSHNIGKAFERLRQYDRSLENYRKALENREKFLGPMHPDVAMSLNHMGNVLYKQGEYAEALEYHRKALAIWDKAVGTEHPDKAMSLSGIGNVFVGQGRPKQAREPLERVVNLCAKNNCEVEAHGLALFSLARVLIATGGDKKRAVKLTRQAREVFLKTPKVFKNELEEVSGWLKKLEGV